MTSVLNATIFGVLVWSLVGVFFSPFRFAPEIGAVLAFVLMLIAQWRYLGSLGKAEGS